jgi:hypothetical protein
MILRRLAVSCPGGNWLADVGYFTFIVVGRTPFSIQGVGTVGGSTSFGIALLFSAETKERAPAADLQVVPGNGLAGLSATRPSGRTANVRLRLSTAANSVSMW